MKEHKIFSMPLADVYPHYLNKLTRKGRSELELREAIMSLTNYTEEDLSNILSSKSSFKDFFANAPLLNPNRLNIKGSICGIKIASMEDGLMKEIRYLDKIAELMQKYKISKGEL